MCAPDGRSNADSRGPIIDEVAAQQHGGCQQAASAHLYSSCVVLPGRTQQAACHRHAAIVLAGRRHGRSEPRHSRMVGLKVAFVAPTRGCAERAAKLPAARRPSCSAAGANCLAYHRVREIACSQRRSRVHVRAWLCRRVSWDRWSFRGGERPRSGIRAPEGESGSASCARHLSVA